MDAQHYDSKTIPPLRLDVGAAAHEHLGQLEDAGGAKAASSGVSPPLLATETSAPASMIIVAIFFIPEAKRKR